MSVSRELIFKFSFGVKALHLRASRGFKQAASHTAERYFLSSKAATKERGYRNFYV